jgi:hypothetical protein
VDEATTWSAKVNPAFSYLLRFGWGKAYTVAQAVRLDGISPATVRRWLKGYEAPGHRMAPVFGGKLDDTARISFLELIELIVASRFQRSDESGTIRSRRSGVLTPTHGNNSICRIHLRACAFGKRAGTCCMNSTSATEVEAISPSMPAVNGFAGHRP